MLISKNYVTLPEGEYLDPRSTQYYAQYFWTCANLYGYAESLTKMIEYQLFYGDFGFSSISGWSRVIEFVTGWWFGTWLLFSIIYWDVILPIDELIFFKMVKTTNQVRIHSSAWWGNVCEVFYSKWICHCQPSSLWLRGIFTPACSATQSWRWGICLLSLYQTQDVPHPILS